jgi:hypothetical protein
MKEKQLSNTRIEIVVYCGAGNCKLRETLQSFQSNQSYKTVYV